LPPDNGRYVTEWLDESKSIPSEVEEDELNKKATEWLKEWQKRRPGSAEYLTGCLEGYKEALKDGKAMVEIWSVNPTTNKT
jgi:hypothetical protein